MHPRPFSLASLLAPVCLTGALGLATPACADDLRSVLERTALTSPDIAVQAGAVTQARGRLMETRAGFLPTVGGTASIERRRLHLGGAQPDDVFTARSAAVEAKLPLFSGFQTLNSVRMRRLELASSKARLEELKQATLLDTVRAYAQVLKDRNILKYNQTQVELVRGLLDATRTRFSRGEATRTDESQAEARLAIAIAGRSVARESLEVSEAEYRAVTGVMPETLDPLPEVLNLPASLEEAQVLAAGESPILEQARLDEEAASRSVKVARGALAPQIEAFSGAQIQSGGIANLITGSLNADRHAYFGGVRADVPIFQGGAEYGAIRRANGLLAQRQAERIVTERDLANQVSKAWAQWRSAAEVIESTRQAVESNEKAAEGVRRESLGGSRTVLDVLDAQRELLDSRETRERAIADEYIARATLLYSVGRLAPAQFAATPSQPAS